MLEGDDAMRTIENAKTKILRAAGDLLKKEGLVDFNMRTIARMAGVSVGTVYNHYPAKAELVFDVMERLLADCVMTISDASAKTIFDAFRNIYFSMLDYFNLFQKNLMRDLSVLASTETNPRASVEHSHMAIFQNAFKNAFEAHRDEIDPRIFTVLGVDRAIAFILAHFNDMIRRNVRDYAELDFILRKLLSK